MKIVLQDATTLPPCHTRQDHVRRWFHFLGSKVRPHGYHLRRYRRLFFLDTISNYSSFSLIADFWIVFCPCLRHFFHFLRALFLSFPRSGISRLFLTSIASLLPSHLGYVLQSLEGLESSITYHPSARCCLAARVWPKNRRSLPSIRLIPTNKRRHRDYHTKPVAKIFTLIQKPARSRSPSHPFLLLPL